MLAAEEEAGPDGGEGGEVGVAWGGGVAAGLNTNEVLTRQREESAAAAADAAPAPSMCGPASLAAGLSPGPGLGPGHRLHGGR